MEARERKYCRKPKYQTRKNDNSVGSGRGIAYHATQLIKNTNETWQYACGYKYMSK